MRVTQERMRRLIRPTPPQPFSLSQLDEKPGQSMPDFTKIQMARVSSPEDMRRIYNHIDKHIGEVVGVFPGRDGLVQNR